MLLNHSRPRLTILIYFAALIFFGVDAMADTVDVSIQDFTFNPAAIEIASGSSVRWTNNDAVPHTSTSDDPYWDSGSLANGESFVFTFDTVGEFPYHCTFHPTMHGTVTVVAARSVPSTTPAGLIILAALLLMAAVFLIYKKGHA